VGLFGMAAMLTGCGGGGDDTPLVAANDLVVQANPSVTAAVAQAPFDFPGGVPVLGTTADTTVTFTSTDPSPAFSISSGGGTATGTTTFGSCIFKVTASTFPAGTRLATGATVTVNPCNLTINSRGLSANGVGQSRSIALILGAAASAGRTLTVSVNPGGGLTLNGTSVGTVTLAPVTGGS